MGSRTRSVTAEEAIKFYGEQINILRTNNDALKSIFIMLIQMLGRDGVINSASILREMRSLALRISESGEANDEIRAIVTEICSIVETAETGPKADLIKFPEK